MGQINDFLSLLGHIQYNNTINYLPKVAIAADKLISFL
jgi:hypothetical protein